jgi:hypothetical protein
MASREFPFVLGIVLLAFSLGACSESAKSKAAASQNRAANPNDSSLEVDQTDSTTEDDPCSQMFSNLFVKVDTISDGNFVVTKLHKSVRDNQTGQQMPVTYATLTSQGRTVAVFDGVYYPLGNSVQFGFADLLGNQSKQLVVSMTVPRGGRHWIVDLSGEGAAVFDSHDWSLGNEDVCVHDYDNDGIKEIQLSITSFWGFGSMSMADSPLPPVVFKYQSVAKKFMPDVEMFARGLNGIEDDAAAIDPDEDPETETPGQYLAPRLDILLRYIYAGKEADGWAFFDAAYKPTNGEELKQQIRRTLNSEPVYRYVYGMPALPRPTIQN